MLEKLIDKLPVREDRLKAQKKVVWLLWSLLIAGFAGVFILFGLISSMDLPTFEELEQPTDKLASQIYTYDDKILDRFYVENRVPLAYGELNPHLISALISTEDVRYWRHSGVDPKAIARVFVKTLLLRRSSAGGGSTISQQLAKLLYSGRNFEGLGRVQRYSALILYKLKEWVTAVKLERSYTKEEILAMYLNHFNFIHGAFGINSAAEIYFGKPQQELNVAECATLVGMLKNPSLYNPVRRPDLVKERRDVVLNQMYKQGELKRSELKQWMDLPLDMSRFRQKDYNEGLAPYFRMVLGEEVKRLLSQPQYFKPDGTPYDIYKDGLRIYTPISQEMQALAEEAALAHMKKLQATFFRAWRGMDPWTYRKEDDPEELLEKRKEMLTVNIRSTERYQRLQSRVMGPVFENIQAKYGDIRDYDLDRLLRTEKEKGYLAELQKKSLLNPEKRKILESLLHSEDWAGIRKQWKDFQALADKEMRKKVKMKVFAYNASGEKDTLMSPLDSIKYHRMFLQIGMLVVDPTTGAIRAWVGGINHKYFKYDHVTSDRQVGSTFKPFVYATAIEMQGISPCMRFTDVPQTISPGEGNFRLETEWTPKNFEGYSGASYTLKDCLKHSINTASVFLIKQLGDVQPVRGLVNLMGIDSSARRGNGRLRIPRQPSICLGSADLKVIEMTGAYSTFANQGEFCKPFLISRIEDKDGKLIYQHIPQQQQALNPQTNYVMVDMLRYVARGLGGFSQVKSDFGGKTGTTNNAVDGWFMGITPGMVAGIWVGGEDQWIRFLDHKLGQGAYMAKPVFASFLQKLESDSLSGYDPELRFIKPEGDLRIEIDCNRYYQKANEAAPTQNTEFFEDIFNDDL